MRLPTTACVLMLMYIHVADAAAPKPHILFVLVDDFGWADLGIHRAVPDPEVVTPTMDRLANEGIHLNRHYIHFMCTPTRSSLQTGRLPVHVQLTLANPCNKDSGIPQNMTGVAQKMRSAGYATHLVGKWDAGMATPHHTPQGRGYQTSLNYFSHGNWMWSEAEWQGSEVNKTTKPECDEPSCAKDFWDTDRPASSLNGTQYEEAIFRDRLTDIINTHDPNEPLFLVYTPKVAHYPLQAPIEYQEKFSFIENDNRRMYHAMVAYLDDNLANITALMKAKGMWDNTLMVLSADNGGYVRAPEGPCDHKTKHGIACFNGEAGANNYPLRGGKYTRFEGGVRGNAFVSGGFVPKTQRGTNLNGVMHIADWYSTFCHLAGVSPEDDKAKQWGLPPIDSLNMWSFLSGETNQSPRTDILIEKGALISGRYKLLVGKQQGSTWAGPRYPNSSTYSNGGAVYQHSIDCNPACLFDLEDDPTEHHDIAAENPTIVTNLMAKLQQEEAKIFQRNIGPNDPECMKTAFSKYGGFLGPWLENIPADVE